MLLVGLATLLLALRLKQLADPYFRCCFQQRVASLGFWGWMAMPGLRILQIVVAFIPGEPVEVVAGVLAKPLHFQRGRFGSHELFHLLFLLAASACHYTLMIGYVM